MCETCKNKSLCQEIGGETLCLFLRNYNMASYMTLSRARYLYECGNTTERQLACSLYSMEELLGKEEYEKREEEARERYEREKDARYDSAYDFCKDKGRYDL